MLPVECGLDVWTTAPAAGQQIQMCVGGMGHQIQVCVGGVGHEAMGSGGVG